MNNQLSCCILRNEQDDDHLLWIKACEEYSDLIIYDVVNLSAVNWHENITKKKYDYLLAKPPGLTARYKQLYDERIHIIDTVLNLPVYPTAREIYIYENKRYLYSWLKANNLSHPDTNIFYNEKDSIDFLKKIKFPIVAKVNIGASGSGVKLLNNKSETETYIEKAFSSKGISKRWGPNFSKGNLLKRGMHYIFNPGDIVKKTQKYKTVKDDTQKGFIIFQEYIPHDFEWRIVAIGDSYFAHKKLKIDDKASGTTLKNYDNPPLYLFDFAKNLMEKYKFTSQAIDVFEQEDGILLINELQCMFGQSDPYQMLIDGKPGRYRFSNGEWLFEEGDFAKNECFDLRVEHVLSLLNKQR